MTEDGIHFLPAIVKRNLGYRNDLVLSMCSNIICIFKEYILDNFQVTVCQHFANQIYGTRR
jgi:hypothetical protein